MLDYVDVLLTMTKIEFERHSTPFHLEKVKTLKSYFTEFDENGKPCRKSGLQLL